MWIYIYKNGGINMEKLFLALSIIFLMLMLACAIATIVGCIKPQLVIRGVNPNKRSKKNIKGDF